MVRGATGHPNSVVRPYRGSHSLVRVTLSAPGVANVETPLQTYPLVPPPATLLAFEPSLGLTAPYPNRLCKHQSASGLLPSTETPCSLAAPGCKLPQIGKNAKYT